MEFEHSISLVVGLSDSLLATVDKILDARTMHLQRAKDTCCHM